MNGFQTGCLAAVIILSGACAASRQGGPEAAPDAADRPADEVNTVTTDEHTTAKSVADLLEGRVPGVHAYRTPGGGIAIRIRGKSSIQGDDAPLYVIDGMPTAPGPDGELPVSIYEIESVQVLKDKAATVRYGVRGAHGVILVKTKPPPDPGR